jgi:hypothetical protein
MRYLMALMLVWGVCQFSSAQTNQDQSKDCPPKVEGQTDNEGVELNSSDADADIQYDNDAYVKGNEDQEFDMESDDVRDPKSDFSMESDEADMDAESNTDINAESNTDAANAEAAPADTGMVEDQSANCPNLDETSSDAGNVTTNNYETTNVVVVEEQDKERSTLGKIWRSPFKLIGNIPKAAVSVVSESAEGVGHIVGAPFKGVAKLFGAEEHDNKDKDENI